MLAFTLFDTIIMNTKRVKGYKLHKYKEQKGRQIDKIDEIMKRKQNTFRAHRL